MKFRRYLLVMLLCSLGLTTGFTVLAGPLEQGKELLAQEQFEQARPLLEDAQRMPGTKAEAALLLTRLCNRQGDWKAGIEYGETAVKLLPESSAAHYEYAVALRQKMSNVGKMKAMFTLGTYKKELKRAMDLDPRNVDALTERIGFLANAPGIAGGDIDEAIEELAKLAKLDWRLAQEQRISIELAREDENAAVGAAEKIVERYPEDPRARLQLGYLLQRAERYKEADKQFAALAGIEERNIALGALYQRGKTRILGDYEHPQAIEFLTSYINQIEEGMRGLPGKAAAYWRLGMAHEQSGQADSARQAYKRALSLDPEFEQAKQALGRMK